MSMKCQKNFCKIEGAVLSYIDAGGHAATHERKVQEQIARKLAALKGYRFAGTHDAGTAYSGRLYFVPSKTLTIDEAVHLGIHSEADLFGGVVPLPFVASKAITHSLIGPDAASPEGWSHGFTDEVRAVTLCGYSAFTRSDAAHAGRRVLEQGRARIKPARGVGGRGQTVVSNAAQLDAALAAIGNGEFSDCGVVVERNLRGVTTFSVGQVRVADLIATYYGTQRLTEDNQGREVYGGSDLTVVRGDYGDLLKLALAPGARLAVTQARIYDNAAGQFFPGFMASRRNYDVAQGLDENGERRSGVLEQSWRIGGASAAEIAALEAFRADPALRFLRASCVEKYGLHDLPANAILGFRGTDDRVGPITRYTVLKSYADS
jgi:uncharacterized protein DUF3182